ncbi:MAG: cupin domain-containing protein [Deinococcales bacterium]
MNIVDLLSQRSFSGEKMQKIPLFASDKMFCDQYCLLPGQSQKIHSHAKEDKVYIVLEGEVICHIDGEEALLSEGQATIAYAHSPHGVRNDSLQKSVLLVVMAPKPEAKTL